MPLQIGGATLDASPYLDELNRQRQLALSQQQMMLNSQQHQDDSYNQAMASAAQNKATVDAARLNSQNEMNRFGAQQAQQYAFHQDDVNHQNAALAQAKQEALLNRSAQDDRLQETIAERQEAFKQRSLDRQAAIAAGAQGRTAAMQAQAVNHETARYLADKKMARGADEIAAVEAEHAQRMAQIGTPFTVDPRDPNDAATQQFMANPTPASAPAKSASVDAADDEEPDDDENELGTGFVPDPKDPNDAATQQRMAEARAAALAQGPSSHDTSDGVVDQINRTADAQVQPPAKNEYYQGNLDDNVQPDAPPAPNDTWDDRTKAYNAQVARQADVEAKIASVRALYPDQQGSNEGRALLASKADAAERMVRETAANGGDYAQVAQGLRAAVLPASQIARESALSANPQVPTPIQPHAPVPQQPAQPTPPASGLGSVGDWSGQPASEPQAQPNAPQAPQSFAAMRAQRLAQEQADRQTAKQKNEDWHQKNMKREDERFDLDKAHQKLEEKRQAQMDADRATEKTAPLDNYLATARGDIDSQPTPELRNAAIDAAIARATGKLGLPAAQPGPDGKVKLPAHPNPLLQAELDQYQTEAQADVAANQDAFDQGKHPMKSPIAIWMSRNGKNDPDLKGLSVPTVVARLNALRSTAPDEPQAPVIQKNTTTPATSGAQPMVGQSQRVQVLAQRLVNEKKLPPAEALARAKAALGE